MVLTNDQIFPVNEIPFLLFFFNSDFTFCFLNKYKYPVEGLLNTENS